MANATQTTTLTIAEVQSNFANWRNSKTGCQKIPAELCSQVKILLNSCPNPSPVLRRLGLTKQQAINKGLVTAHTAVPCSANLKSNNFIQIPMPLSITATEIPRVATANIKRGDAVLSLNINSDKQLQLIINAFIR